MPCAPLTAPPCAGLRVPVPREYTRSSDWETSVPEASETALGLRTQDASEASDRPLIWDSGQDSVIDGVWPPSRPDINWTQRDAQHTDVIFRNDVSSGYFASGGHGPALIPRER